MSEEIELQDDIEEIETEEVASKTVRNPALIEKKAGITIIGETKNSGDIYYNGTNGTDRPSVAGSKLDKLFVFGDMTYRMDVGQSQIPFTDETRNDSQKIDVYNNINDKFITENCGRLPSRFSVVFTLTQLLGVNPDEQENELRRAMANKVRSPISINGEVEKSDGDDIAFWSISSIDRRIDPTKTIRQLTVTFVEVNEDLWGYNSQDKMAAGLEADK